MLLSSVFRRGLIDRCRLLIKRRRIAEPMGFHFFGTSYSKIPRSLRLYGKNISLVYPNDQGHLFDLINICLDDEYGLLSIDGEVKSIIDVGANIGLFSLWARHHFPAARIHAYEPNEEMVQYASRNISGAKVSLFKEGISSEDGTGRLVTNDSSRMVKVHKDSCGLIKLTGLDVAIARIGGKLDLLKLDCEGGEWEIFLKSKPFRSIRHIRMEYHFNSQNNLTSLTSAASELGFEITRLRPNGDFFGIAWLKNLRMPS